MFAFGSENRRRQSRGQSAGAFGETAGRGGGGAEVGYGAVLAAADLNLENIGYTVIPYAGAITPNFTRATTKRIVDSWGRMVTCLAGEVAFPGARRVQNLCSGSSQDNTAGSATTATTTVTATTLTFTAINASYWYRQSTTITNGNTYTCSADISCSVARKVLVRASASGGGAGATNDLSVTSTSQRVSLTFTASAAGVVIFGIDNRAAVGASDTSTSGTVTFTNIQIEDVTGQSVQTAGEYVSVGVVQRNLLLNTNDLTTATWTKINGGTGTAPTVTSGQSDPNGGTTGFRVQANCGAGIGGGDYSIVRQAIAAGTSCKSLWVKSNTGGSQTFSFTTGTVSGNVTATTSWQRLSASNAVAVFDIGTSGAGGTTQSLDLLVWHPQAEIGTTPTDYQDVGGTYAYHGSCVDGVKCFPTDLSGNPLPTAATFNAVSLNGASGTYVSTPDSVANSITGDIDIRVKAALVDWTPSVNNVLAAKWGAAGLQSWLLYVNTAGKLVWFMSSDGTASTDNTITSSVATPFLDGAVGWVRVTKSVSTGYVNYYTSSDGVAWTQLGTANLAGSVSAIFDSAMQMEVGSYLTGNAPVAGRIYQAQIYNGINGTLAVAFDASRYSGGGSTLTGSTGETWTLNGNAVIHPTNIPMTTPLIELAATNICLQSENLSITWTLTGSGSYSLDATTAPNGTVTADKIQEAATTNFHGYAQSFTKAASALTYTVSWYAKQAERTKCLITADDGVIGTYFWFDLSAGTILSKSNVGAGFTATSHTIEAAANGFYRIQATFTSSTSTALNIGIFPTTTDGVSSYAGTLNSGIYVWGAQVELGSKATSYIPTTTVAVARNADQLYYTGALIGNLKSLAVRGFKRDAGFSNTGVAVGISNAGSANDAVQMFLSSATAYNFQGLVGGVSQWNQTASNAYTPVQLSNAAQSFAANDIKMAKDGIAQTADTSATIPTITRLEYGMVAGVFQLNGYPGKVYGWTRNLSQSELNGVTV